jgi:N-glycosylase/DNA lyase
MSVISPLRVATVTVRLPNFLSSSTRRLTSLRDKTYRAVGGSDYVKRIDKTQFSTLNSVAPTTDTASMSRSRSGKGKGHHAVAESKCYGELTEQNVSAQNWIDLQAPKYELRLQFTLGNGQYFSWKKFTGTEVYVGVIDGIPVALKQTDATTLFRPLLPALAPDDFNQKLRSYFQLHIPLKPLYAEWSAACPRLAVIANHLPGVRILDQDPWECVISFITSSNNNQKRITQLIDSTRRKFGKYICSVAYLDAADSLDVQKFTPSQRASLSGNEYFHLFDFPDVDTLAAAPASAYTELGFGYRAEYIKRSSEYVQSKGGLPWLYSLKAKVIGPDFIVRSESSPVRLKGKRKYDESGDTPLTEHDTVQDVVVTELLEMHGVGRKVADCIALFSFNRTGIIPVDTHVFDIALRDYLKNATVQSRISTASSMTPSVYNIIAECFRTRFGPYAGWAHSLLFCAELTEFRQYLPKDVIDEMQAFNIAKKSVRKESKDNKAAEKVKVTRKDPVKIVTTSVSKRGSKVAAETSTADTDPVTLRSK